MTDYHIKSYYKEIISQLESRGVTINDIVDIVMGTHFSHLDFTKEQASKSVIDVLNSPTVQQAIFIAIFSDTHADEMEEPLKSWVKQDRWEFGGDEANAITIVNVFGDIAVSMFGQFDKSKPGIIGRLSSDETQINTYLDDVVAALAAAATALSGRYYGYHESVKKED